jgi:glutathione S-transferase
MAELQLYGRRSSHWTRVARIFSHELNLELPYTPIQDMAALDADAYGGHPALRLPALSVNGDVLVGTLNICRALVAAAGGSLRVVWPETAAGLLLANSHELTLQAMATQVTIVFARHLAKIPDDNLLLRKSQQSLEGSLRWLDERLAGVIAQLPARDLSFLEVSLFCLLDHLNFRQTAKLADYPLLQRFHASFGERHSAQATPFGFD